MATWHAPNGSGTYVFWRTRIATPRWFDEGRGPRDDRGFCYTERLWAWMRERGLIRIRMLR